MKERTDVFLLIGFIKPFLEKLVTAQLTPCARSHKGQARYYANSYNTHLYQLIVSTFCWSPIRSDVWGYKGHRGLYMMCYWMEINSSLFCQLLLTRSATICCLTERRSLSFSFLFSSCSHLVRQRNRLGGSVQGSCIHFLNVSCAITVFYCEIQSDIWEPPDTLTLMVHQSNCANGYIYILIYWW